MSGDPRICEECKQEFRPRVPRSRPQKFCSNACRLVALQRIPRPMKGKGSGYTSQGYRVINVQESDGSARIVREHRYVMERHLGRRLLPDEVVHHINHDKSDNRIENLELVQSQADHIRQHHPSPGGKRLPEGKWSRNYDQCVECGRNDSRYAARGTCARCCEARRRARAKQQAD